MPDKQKKRLNGRQAMLIPPNIYQINRVISRYQAYVSKNAATNDNMG
jgi:hypothetical protein